MVLVSTGVAVVVLGALVCVAAASVVEHRAERTAARGLTFAADPADAQGWATVRRIPYGERMLLRVDIDPRDLEVLPPGLSRWPGRGELIASPAAADLMAHDPVFADYAPGEVTGRVTDEGLRAPDELVVYRGVDRAEQPGGGIAVVDRGRAPGATDRDTADIPPGQVAGLVVLLAVVVGLPVIAFLSVAARLSAATRARRLGSLHLLGAPQRFLRRVNAVEVGSLTVVGWVVGVGSYPAVNTWLAGSSLLGSPWFSTDTALSPAGALVLLALLLVFALVVATRADVGERMTRVSVRASAAGSRLSRWRLVPLAFGLVSLVVQVITGARRPEGATLIRLDLVMFAAVLLTAAGIVLAVPVIVQTVGSAVASTMPRLAARLGGARAAFDPAGAGRLVTALALTIVAAGVMIGQTRDARAVSVPVTASVPVTIGAWEVPEGSAASLAESAGAPVLGVVTSATASSSTVVVAPCAVVAQAMSGAGRASLDAFHGCTDDSTFVTDSSAADADVIAALVPDAPVPSTSVALPAHVAESIVNGGFDVLVTRSPADLIDSVPFGPRAGADGTTSYMSGVDVVVMATPSTVTEVVGGVLEVAPYSQPLVLGLDPDSGAHIAMVNGFVRLGLGLGALVTLVALATALADRATGRLRADLELFLVGAEPRLLRAVHRWEVGVTVGSGVAVALVCGVLGGLAWQYAGGLVKEPDAPAITALVLVGVLACAAAGVTAGFAVPRRPELTGLRSE